MDATTNPFVDFYQKHPAKVQDELDFFGSVGGIMGEFVAALKANELDKAQAIYDEHQATLTGGNSTEEARLSALLLVKRSAQAVTA